MASALDSVKVALRIKNNALDLEIEEIIDAALIDLSTSGVVKLDKKDPLILQAIKTYAKAEFGLNNKDSEKYKESYEMLKAHLSLCGDYNDVE